MGNLPNKIVQLRSQKDNKFIGRPNELTIDWCNRCLVVHDGITPGGCFRICEAIDLCEQIAELPITEEIAELDVIDNVCDVIGTLTDNGNTVGG